MEQIQYLIATDAHISGINALQEKYLYARLSEEERQAGFVTTPFTVVQIEEVISRGELFIGQVGGEVLAYVFTGSWEFFESWPIFPHMFATLNGSVYKGYTINVKNTYQYGPICIDKSLRGQGVNKEIFEFMKRKMANQYPVGLTFINKVNEVSYAAHTRKMGLDLIGDFEWNGNQYYSLGFLTKGD
jgi:hypothetical protein